ncbi:MAG: TolC family protein, partial [bacterium]|nr:TolC family protein [bacterium]
PFMPTSSFGDIMGGFGDLFEALGIPPMSIGGEGKKITIGQYDNYGATLSLQQPIFTGGKIKNAFNIAQISSRVAESDYQKSKSDLILNVEKSYWTVIQIQEFAKVAQEAVDLMQAHLQDLDNMYQVGMVTNNDLLLAKVQLSNARLNLIKANNGVKMAKTGFCSVIGIPLTTDVVLSDTLNYQPLAGVDLRQSIQNALINRPEKQTMNLNIKMAKKGVSITKAGYYPNIFVVGNYNYKRPDREYNPDFYTSWNISLLAQLNLFDWGESSLKVQEARNRLVQLQQVDRQLEDGINLEVTQSFLALNEAKEKIEATKINVEQAKENYRVTDEKFKQGLATNTELLDANILLTKAKTDYISAKIDYKIATASLRKATANSN